MKYKVGDEVLVKAKIIGCLENRRYAVMANVATTVDISLIDKIHIREDDIVPVPDMTAEEAWKILSKILLYPANGGYSAKELEEIFGRTEHLWELTPQEAKAKIEAWEVAKEIKVGDVVERDGDIGVVTNIFEDGFSNVLLENGETRVYQLIRLKKTGRRIDITGLLNQIGGDE